MQTYSPDFQRSTVISELEIPARLHCPQLESSSEDIHPYAVVCGRDKLAQSHPGNKFFRNLVQSHRERYQDAHRRKDKKAVATGIIDTILHHGGCFLRFDDETRSWVELDQAESYEKVSHALRSAKAPKARVKRRTPSQVLKADIPDGDDAFRQIASRQQEIFAGLRTAIPSIINIVPDSSESSYEDPLFLPDDEEESIESMDDFLNDLFTGQC